MLGEKFTHRTGILIDMEDENGKKGKGEISPLSGMHRETIDDNIKLLPNIKNKLLFNPISKDLTGYLNYDMDDLPPSVHFGIESAIISMRANQNNTIPAKLFNKKTKKRLSLNALLLRGEMDNIGKIKSIKKAGYRAIKLKTGSNTFLNDVEHIRRMNDIFEGNIAFRIDTNRTLTLNEAVRFSKMIDPIPVDYFEEPLKDPTLLPQFYNETGQYYAIDETIWQSGYNKQWFSEGLKAVVIKPQLFGGFSELSKIVKQFRKRNIQIVISDIFSSGVGINMLAQYAASIDQPDVPMGLYTYSYLREDVLCQRHEIIEGEIDINDSHEKSQRLDLMKLKKLDV